MVVALPEAADLAAWNSSEAVASLRYPVVVEWDQKVGDVCLLASSGKSRVRRSDRLPQVPAGV